MGSDGNICFDCVKYSIADKIFVPANKNTLSVYIPTLVVSDLWFSMSG